MASYEEWELLPDPLLLQIFSYLDAQTLSQCASVCYSWHRVSLDNFIWKSLFFQKWKIDRNIPIAPRKKSWRSEYRRLKYKTPIVETEVLVEHAHQVLHVSFSHNGQMFSSCSKDGFIKVWCSSYPASVIYSADMKDFSWSYTQFSQFNSSDTLLLVSGVHFGPHTASGEIAVFNLQNNFTLQCRVLNKPYDLFGTWYTDNYLLSGRLQFLGHLVSCSALWLNKASQESESERKPIIKRLFRFHNRNASSIRTITVANCLCPRTNENDSCLNSTQGSGGHENPSLRIQGGNNYPDFAIKGNPVSHNALSSSQWRNSTRRRRSTDFVPLSSSLSQETKMEYGAEGREACTMDSPIRYSQEYRRAEKRHSPIAEGTLNSENPSLNENVPVISPVPVSSQQGSESELVCSDENDTEEDSLEEDLAAEKILDHREKFLIFTTGSLTYTPHQIGFKRIKPFKFAEMVKETTSLTQRLRERRTGDRSASPAHSLQEEENLFYDKVDHIIDLHGHIIGMGLSPDHRYLYVNSRPWPKGYDITNALAPPPIAQEIDIHVIDLVTLKEVGTMLQSHKAYTPNDECFFIFLDVSEQYVASGAEDKHGYIWDRHYGNCLAKLPHSDVVNSVAFNPKDPEMLVTASDDFTLKVWRSKNRASKLKVNVT